MVSKLEFELQDLVNENMGNEQFVFDDYEDKLELKFGHTISLQLYEMKECFLTTDGFMKPKVHAEKICYTNQDKALFMIYPSFNTSNLDKLHQLPMMTKSEKKLFEKRVIDDYKQNLDIFEKMKGTPVLFDSPLQLLNINTNKFLSCNYSEAEEEKQNFKLELQEFSSKNTLFKIIPSFSHQDKKDGIVFSNDIVMIVSAEKYLGRDPYVQCNVQKFKDSISSQITIQKESPTKSFLNRSSSIKKGQQKDKTNEMLESHQNQTNKPEKPNKNYFIQIDTTTTEMGPGIGQDELEVYQKGQTSPKSNFNLTQIKTPQQEKFKNKSDGKDELNQSSEAKSGILDTNLQVHETVRHSQIHKFKKDVDQRNISNQMMIPPVEKDSNLLQINNQNVIPTNPSPFFPQNQFRVQPLTLNNYEKNRQHETEVNVSLETKTKWVIRSFCEVIEDEDIVCYGDKIWLHHLETANNLVTQRNLILKEEENKKVNPDVLEHKQDQNRQRQCIKFEATTIKESTFIKYSGNTKGMWILERGEKLKGGPAEFNQIVYFKHFSTRKYLELVKYPCGKDDSAYYFDLADEPNLSCSFVLVKLPSSGSKNQKYLTKDSFFYLRSVEFKIKTNTYLEEYLGYNQGVDVAAIAIDEAAFKLFRATHSEILETYFLTQCYPILVKNVDNFQLQQRRGTSNRIDQKAKESIMQLSQTIQYINQFCLNQIVLTSIDNQRNFSKISAHRQKIIQEQYLIDELIEIVKCIVKEQDLKRIREEKKYENYKNAPLAFSLQTQKNVEKMKRVIQKEKNIDLNISLSKFGRMQFESGNEGKAFFFAIDKFDENRVQTSNQYLLDKIEVLKKIYQLLVIVCQDNGDNQNLVYKKLTSFQNHAAYIKEAADFVISIVSQNETILSNLSDDIKITYDNNPEISNSNNNIFMRQESRNNTLVNLDDPNKKSDNLILFFKENAIHQHREKQRKANKNYFHSKDQNILNFFRNICKFQGKGVSVNQEQIHKFCYQDDVQTDFYKSIFYSIKGEDKRLKIDLNGKKVQIGNSKNAEDIPQDTYLYVIEQINFCSDLCLSRNYLWKRDLKGDFPVEFVFKFIFDNSVDDKLRSAFCNLALSLYIDHEPLNKKQVPNMCRIFRADGEGQNPKFNQKNIDYDYEEHDENIIYAYTIDKIIKYINQEFVKLKKSFEEYLENQDKKNKGKVLKYGGKTETQFEDTVTLFDNCLTLDIIKMLATFVKFDILTLIKQSYMYRSIVTTLLQLLEYDKNLRNYSYVINKVRQERYKNAISNQKKNKLLSNFTGFIVNASKNIAQAGKQIAGEVAGIVGAMIGVQYVRSSEETDEEQLEATNSLYSKNPMIGGLVTLKSMFQGELNENENHIEIEVKIEICELFIFQQNLRMDYLLSNFLSWFDIISKKHQRFSGKKIITEIEEDIPTIIPELYKTGIDEIELKIIEQAENPKSNFDSLEGFTNMLSFKKKKKFVNYTNEEQVMNLDSLLEGDVVTEIQDQKKPYNQKMQQMQEEQKNQNTDAKQEVLPSLLCGFFMTKNHKVEDKILEVLRNCFNQTNILFDNLYQLEVLFDQRDIIPYMLLRKKISKLRQYAEESEVWLSDFLRTQQPPEKMKQTQQVLSEINELFYFDVNIEDDNIVVPSAPLIEHAKLPKRQIDKVRQKVFTFLQGHFSLINLVRDSQNQMAKLLKSKNVSNSAKSVIHKLLSSLYRCLTLYCDNFEENQNILSKYTSFFLDEIEFDFGQLDLVCSIYKNNKFLCETFPENLSTFLINNISVIGRQQRFLKLFKIILTYKDQKNRVTTNLIENQIKIIQWFLPKENSDKAELQKYQKLLYCNLDPKNKLQITFNYDKAVDKNGDQIKDVPFFYHAELLDLFIQTLKGDESSSINVSKLKKVFPQAYLLDILLRDDAFVPSEKFYVYQYNPNVNENNKRPSTYIYDYTENFYVEDEREGLKLLKPKIIDFLLAVYFNEDKPVNDSIKDHKRFYQLCSMEYERLMRQIDQHPQDYIQYICGKFLKIALFYLKKIIRRENQQDYKEQDEYKILYNISTRLFDIRFQFDEMLDKQQFQEYTEFMKEINEQYHKNYFEQIQSALKPELKKNESQMSKKTFFKAQYNWKIFLNICRNSDVVKDCIEQEMSVLAESILKIKQIFPEEYRKQYKLDLQYQEIIKKLISYLQTGIVNKANPDNMIFVFGILEQILKDCEDDKMLEEMQNLLDSLDATKMCLHLLSDSKQNPIEKKELLHAILEFLIKLLEGGNSQIQATVFDYFMTFPKSEVIFQLIHSIIHDFIEDLKEKKKIEIMKIQSQMMSNFDIMTNINQSLVGSKKNLAGSKTQFNLDQNGQQDVQSKQQKSQIYKQPLKSNKKSDKNQDDDDESSGLNKSQAEIEFDEDKDPHRKSMKMINSHILMKSLRVLQLFCEGHNLELQNYIRYQRNSRTNYDMVTIIIDLLYIFYDNIDEENFENMIKCLDTLIEFVQGPCKMNQETIIDSKFFQFAEDILEGYDQQKHEKKKLHTIQSSTMLNQSMTSLTRSANRSSTKTKTMINQMAQKTNTQILKPWMLEQIKYKTMILVTSLLELNSEPLVIKRIMRSLPLEVLKKNLIDIYKKHKKLYNEQYLIQCFGHHEGEPEGKGGEKEKEYYNYIIETGFFIFFLLSYYTDLDENDLDIEISTKLNEIKNDFKDSKSIFSLKKGIIQQLYTFIYSILESLFQIVRGITNKIQKEMITKKVVQEVDVEKQIKEDNTIFKQALSFFNKNSGSIEIIREGKLEKIRFVLLPFCHYLPKQNKVEFHDYVDRDSIHSKLSVNHEPYFQYDSCLFICQNIYQYFLHYYKQVQLRNLKKLFRSASMKNSFSYSSTEIKKYSN